MPVTAFGVLSKYVRAYYLGLTTYLVLGALNYDTQFSLIYALRGWQPQLPGSLRTHAR